MSDTTKTTTDAADPIDRPCEECGAQPGEPCRPYCTAEPAVTAAWTTFDRSTYREAGPMVIAPDTNHELRRWCLTARRAMGPWVWYLIDRLQTGPDGYALVAASGEARTLRKARAAAEAALAGSADPS